MRSFSIVLAVSMMLSVSAQSADTLTVVLTGDILLDRGVRQTINRHGSLLSVGRCEDHPRVILPVVGHRRQRQHATHQHKNNFFHC